MRMQQAWFAGTGDDRPCFRKIRVLTLALTDFEKKIGDMNAAGFAMVDWKMTTVAHSEEVMTHTVVAVFEEVTR